MFDPIDPNRHLCKTCNPYSKTIVSQGCHVVDAVNLVGWGVGVEDVDIRTEAIVFNLHMIFI